MIEVYAVNWPGHSYLSPHILTATPRGPRPEQFRQARRAFECGNRVGYRRLCI